MRTRTNAIVKHASELVDVARDEGAKLIDVVAEGAGDLSERASDLSGKLGHVAQDLYDRVSEVPAASLLPVALPSRRRRRSRLAMLGGRRGLIALALLALSAVVVVTWRKRNGADHSTDEAPTSGGIDLTPTAKAG
jgi:hypothetical protein